MTHDAASGFRQFFEREMKAALPLPLPAALVALITQGDGESKLPLLVGSASARNDCMLVEADIGRLPELPIGYFVAGFWGHGINSYAFYWCEVTPSARVFFRLPYGGVYSDIEIDRRTTLRFLANWADFVARRIPSDIRSLTAIDSMGAGEWKFEMADGKKAIVMGSAFTTGDFDAMLAEALAGGDR